MRLQTFATETFGRPVGADKIPWIGESVFYRWSSPRDGEAARWRGFVKAEYVGSVDDDPSVEAGIGIAWRYRLPCGRTFVWRYAYGSPYGFDAAHIVME